MCMKLRAFYLAASLVAASSAIAELPDGYWSIEQSQPILDATLDIVLATDLAQLTSAEAEALESLLAAGRIMHELYIGQLHAEALDAQLALDGLHEEGDDRPATGNLRKLFYLSNGPIVTTLENERLPFLPVADANPGKNVYPAGLTREEIDAFLAANPDKAPQLLAERTVVRRASAVNVAADIGMLDDYPAIDELHLGLREQLQSLGADDEALRAYDDGVDDELDLLPEIELETRAETPATEAVTEAQLDEDAHANAKTELFEPAGTDLIEMLGDDEDIA